MFSVPALGSKMLYAGAWPCQVQVRAQHVVHAHASTPGPAASSVNDKDIRKVRFVSVQLYRRLCSAVSGLLCWPYRMCRKPENVWYPSRGYPRWDSHGCAGHPICFMPCTSAGQKPKAKWLLNQDEHCTAEVGGADGHDGSGSGRGDDGKGKPDDEGFWEWFRLYIETIPFGLALMGLLLFLGLFCISVGLYYGMGKAGASIEKAAGLHGASIEKYGKSVGNRSGIGAALGIGVGLAATAVIAQAI